MRAVLTAWTVVLCPALVKADDWTGQRVVTKRAGLPLCQFGPKGEQTPCGVVREVAATVLGDVNGWLRVRQAGTEGWFPKSEAVLLRDAAEHFTKLIAAYPTDPDSRFRRGVVWKERGEWQKAAQDLTEAIRLEPTAPAYFDHRGTVLKLQGEYAQAVRDYTEAIRLDPTRASFFYNRGILRRAMREPEMAIGDYTECIRLDPGFALAFNNRGLVWQENLGEFDKAVLDYTESIRLDPADATPRYNRARCWVILREDDKAVVDLTDAVRLEPTLAVAYHDRAVLRACADPKRRDGRSAVEDARRACELTAWKEPRYLATLAAAYAEAGLFDEAIRWQKAALADPRFERQFGGTGRYALSLYEQKKPWQKPGE